MFNLNKIINRIRDNDKATPPGSPLHQAVPLTDADTSSNGADVTAEGFLCPSCMERFSSPEELQNHYENYHVDGNLHVCPVCKIKFPTTDQLQIHYATDHAPSISSSSDLRTLRQEVAELQTTLREERWYSEDLKREVTRLTESVNRGEEPEENALMKHQLKALEESRSLLSSEVVLLRNQLAEALETNATLKQQKDIIKQKIASTTGDKEELLSSIEEERTARILCERKISEIQALNTNLEIQLEKRPQECEVVVLQDELLKMQEEFDKLHQERTHFEEQYTLLKAETTSLSQTLTEVQEALAKAPKLEDVDDLKKMLKGKDEDFEQNRENAKLEKETLIARIQELENTLNSKESSIQQQLEINSVVSEEHCTLKEQMANLRIELDDSREMCDRLQVELNEVKITLRNHDAEFEAERNLLTETQQLSSAEVAQRDQLIIELKQRHEQIMLELQEKDSQLNSSKKQLSTLQSHFQHQSNHVDETKSQLRELQMEIEKERRLKANCDEKIKELEVEIMQRQETVKRLESERLELYTKIEAGDGASEAINQLRQKELSLQEKIAEMQQLASNQTTELTRVNEEFHHRLQQCKSQMQTDQEKLSKLETRLDSETAELASMEKRCLELETSLKVKSEAFVSAQAVWSKQSLELQNQLLTFKTNAENKTAELEGTLERLKKTAEDLEASNNVNKALELKLEKQRLEWDESFKGLTEQLGEQKSKVLQLCDEIEDLSAKLRRSATNAQLLEAEREKENEMFIKHKNEFENTISSRDSLISELETRNSALLMKNEESENQTRTSVMTMKDMIKNLRNDFSALNQDQIDTCGKLTNEIHALKEEVKKLDAALLDASETIAKQTEEENNLKAKVDELEVQCSTIKQESSQLCECLNEKEAENENLLLQLKNNQSQNEAKLNETEAHLKETAASLKASEENCRSQSEVITSLQERYAEAQSQLQQLESDLAQNVRQLNELSDLHNKTVTDLRSCGEEISDLSNKLAKSLQENANLQSKADALNEELSGSLQITQTTMLQKTSLETELFDTQKALSELEEKHAALEQNVLELERQLMQEEESAQLKVTEFHEARELLINQKLEIQKKLSSMEEQCKREVANHEKLREEASKESGKLHKQISHLSSQLATVQETRNALEQEVERQKTVFDMQIGTLRENLSTLRSDLVNQQEKAQTLDKKVDELSGDKLELEAKLENALDERRALLERCLSSESECDKLRGLTVELRRKLEDALSALHELGRENQTLQLETAKHIHRKWANDSEVLNCTACQKAFSVTMRKHHCRNCGNIFCHECSSHNAAIAAQKKPVRVCDGCYNELCNK